MTPTRLKQLLFAFILASALLILYFTRQTVSKYSLDYYVRKGMVVKAAKDSVFLANYVQTALPPDASSQFASPANHYKGTRIFVIRDDSVQSGGFQPFNAMYNPVLDAIFLDYRLLKLAEYGRGAGGGTLLAFVLLHELGHRTLHRDIRKNQDFINFKSEDEENWFGRIGFFQKKEDTAAIRREEEADRWAVDQYLEMIPKDSLGIFIKEPDNLPILNLIEGGLLTSISQNGPYSPILQNANHPALYSRVLNFLYALSHSKKLFPRDAIFYAMEAMKLQKFLQHLQRFLSMAVVLPEGDIPVSQVLDRDTLWVLSYKNKLYWAILPFNKATGKIIPHVQVIDTHSYFPTVEDTYELFASGKNLYMVSEDSKFLYLFDKHLNIWREYLTLPGDKNTWVGNQLYSYKYDTQSKILTVYLINSDSKHVTITGSFNCSAAISIYPFSVRISGKRSYLFILDDLQELKIYKLQSGKANFMQAFSNVKEFEVDQSCRYIQMSYDKDNLPDSVLSTAHYDHLKRLYFVDQNGLDTIRLHDFGQILDAVDIFDLDKNVYVKHNVMINSDCNENGLPDRFPTGKVYSLHKEYYTVVDEAGKIIITDELLRPTSTNITINNQRGKYSITEIPYSRYILVFNFEFRHDVSNGYNFTLKGIDL